MGKSNRKKNLKVSVLITNYNNEKYILECINSVKQQSYKNIEILVNDDNSVDNSIEILKKLNNVKLIENKTVTKFYSVNHLLALKNLVKKSTGEIIFFLDGDDYFHLKKIEKIVNFFESNDDCKIVFDYPIYVYGNKYVFEKKKLKVFKSYWPYIHPTSCISMRKNVVNDLFNSISFGDYNNTWMDFRTCIYSNYILKNFIILEDNLTYYRQTNTHYSSNYKKYTISWWRKRLEAHEFFFDFARRNNIKIKKNLDVLVTKLINVFL